MCSLYYKEVRARDFLCDQNNFTHPEISIIQPPLPSSTPLRPQDSSFRFACNLFRENRSYTPVVQATAALHRPKNVMLNVSRRVHVLFKLTVARRLARVDHSRTRTPGGKQKYKRTGNRSARCPAGRLGHRGCPTRTRTDNEDHGDGDNVGLML